MKLFFDVNVILDVLAKREPWAEDSGAALSLVGDGRTEGFVAAHTITTLHYLLRKHHGRETTAAALVGLLALVRAVRVDHETLLKALSLGWTDFEDAVQGICALQVEADYLVTRDPGTVGNLSVAAVSPSELLGILAEPQKEGGGGLDRS